MPILLITTKLIDQWMASQTNEIKKAKKLRKVPQFYALIIKRPYESRRAANSALLLLITHCCVLRKAADNNF